VQVRLLLGSAGSGKTFQCLSEARQALAGSPEGLRMALVAPKQGTYQLEQQLLQDDTLQGYTRLSILSFEALARFVFTALNRKDPELLNEEGRIMVLRALMTERRDDLKVFRASARMTGFARQLSRILAEVKRAGLNSERLRRIASESAHGLALKLQDLATLLEGYDAWVTTHGLQDQDVLLKNAIDLLRAPESASLSFERLWFDGFADFCQLELDFICSLVSLCRETTLTFCLDSAPRKKTPWLSHWSVVSHSFEECRARLSALPDVKVQLQQLSRDKGRFASSPVLQHLETCWGSPRPYQSGLALPGLETFVPGPQVGGSLRMVACRDREAEVLFAAREIKALVRTGARYRDISVLVRSLDPYHQLIQRVFSQFDIPCFLDRRESVAHHPLAELTRSAVRVVTFGWKHEDWFAALKSGLVTARDEEVDLLENEALARGWNGHRWLEPIRLREIPRNDSGRERLEQLEDQLESIRRKLLPAFEKFSKALAGSRPTGPELALALREFWADLKVEAQLESMAEDPSGSATFGAASPHMTVWRQLNAWLDNAELAFPRERLSLREWVPILEAGLANLSIGIIPPLLDQVLVGAVERSRTPEVRFALVLGLNESVFPARPDSGTLLTESDRLELEQRQVLLGATARRHLSRERYLAYIACTRAREKLILTWAVQDPCGSPLLPSSVLSRVAELFPAVLPEQASVTPAWMEVEHPSELTGPLLTELRSSPASQPIPGLSALPWLTERWRNLDHLSNGVGSERLSPELAARLYGPVLRTSVSRMEQFAACPFKFFVDSGLRAEERRKFDLDPREQGTFQHDVLALFHQHLRAEGKRWRDVTPQQARERIGRIAREFTGSFREGLLEASHRARFTARIMTESLQDFVETLVTWMRGQYRFDPAEVEFPFGETEGSPAWSLPLEDGRHLQLRGRIDRVDLHHLPDGQSARCVVVDYKSSHKQLDPLLITHGLQLQLLTYLNVVRHWPNARNIFGADRLLPAGVFYVNLRGQYDNETNRLDALADPVSARKLAYRHSGRFDVDALPDLDARTDVTEGDQFNYRLTTTGELNKQCREALDAQQFESLLEQVTTHLRHMGQQIYAGVAAVGPYRKGIQTACDQCSYQSVCRVDPWTHSFRILRPAASPGSNRAPNIAKP
jgi:ATP-dependent helicase/nuclease subunit B